MPGARLVRPAALGAAILPRRRRSAPRALIAGGAGLVTLRHRCGLAACFCGRCAESLTRWRRRLGRQVELRAAPARKPGGRGRSRTPPAGRWPWRRPPRGRRSRRDRSSAPWGARSPLRHLDSGSCNACDWELAALAQPGVRRPPHDFVARPATPTESSDRPGNRNLEQAARQRSSPRTQRRHRGRRLRHLGGIGRSHASAGGQKRCPSTYSSPAPPRRRITLASCCSRPRHRATAALLAVERPAPVAAPMEPTARAYGQTNALLARRRAHAAVLPVAVAVVALLGPVHDAVTTMGQPAPLGAAAVRAVEIAACRMPSGPL